MESIQLGLIADVQYCDCDNALNFMKTKQRFYRNGINHLDNALTFFSSNNCRNVLQLGDLIDGKCRRLNITEEALQLMKTRFETNEFETFHVTGNHELYNLSREEYCESFMGKSLRKYQPNDIDLNYYRVDLSAKFSLIVLDCYDVSILNRRQVVDNDPDLEKARNILMDNNKNTNLNDPVGATQPKFVAYNGAIGEKQMKWFDDQLRMCCAEDKTVIVAGHVPIICNHPDCIVWNSEELLDILYKYPCVKAYIAGHCHQGEVIRTKQFIHITMPGIIECPPDDVSYGIMTITDTGIRLSSLLGYWDVVEFIYDKI